MASHSTKDVLLIGYGAVGAVCMPMPPEILEAQYSDPHVLPDSLILKNSGRARVTVVARSNYDVVNGMRSTDDPPAAPLQC